MRDITISGFGLSMSCSVELSPLNVGTPRTVQNRYNCLNVRTQGMRKCTNCTTHSSHTSIALSRIHMLARQACENLTITGLSNPLICTLWRHGNMPRKRYIALAVTSRIACRTKKGMGIAWRSLLRRFLTFDDTTQIRLDVRSREHYLAYIRPHAWTRSCSLPTQRRRHR